MRSQVASTVCKAIGALRSHRGQSTVEFAIVLAAFICIALGLSSLWHAFDRGLLVQYALQSASHHLQSVDLGAWSDVLAY